MWITIVAKLRTRQTFLYYIPSFACCQENEGVKFCQATLKEWGFPLQTSAHIDGRELPRRNEQYTWT